MRKYLLILLALAFIGHAAIVSAHGGGTIQIENARVGDYVFSVWALPNPLRVGEAHISAAVSEIGATNADGRVLPGKAVLNLPLTLTARPTTGSDTPLQHLLTHADALNPQFYEADFELPSAGAWEMAFVLDGMPTPSFTIDVEKAPFPINLLALITIPILLALWTIWQKMRKNA